MKILWFVIGWHTVIFLDILTYQKSEISWEIHDYVCNILSYQLYTLRSVLIKYILMQLMILSLTVYKCHVMKWVIQWWSTNLPISTKQIATSHLKSLNIKTIMTYDIGNAGPGLGQAHTCGRVKLHDWTLSPSSLNNWISSGNT